MTWLAVAGSLNMDLVGRAPRIPAPGETVLGGELARFHGGKGGNQAVAAARLNTKVRFFGAVGNDAAADELLAGLASEGIDTGGVVRAPAPSGCALITVSEAGENAITVLPGANREAPLPAAPALPGARALLLQLEIPLATNIAWATAAREGHAPAGRVPVLLNAAPVAADAATLAAVVSELLPRVDLLVVNESELAALGGAESSLGPPVVVVTLGERGCRVWQRGRSVAVPGHAVPVVDTTGAGDTFVGALAAALARGSGLMPAVTEANLAAALSCGAVGARGGMPMRAALDAALAERVGS